MIYPANFEAKTGFDKIREKLKTFCLSELGRKKVDEICFLSDYEEVVLQLQETEEFVQICLNEDVFPTSYYFDLRPYLSKIRVEGTYLEQLVLFDLKRSLDSIRSIVRFFQRKESEEYPKLRNLIQPVKIYPYVSEKLNMVLDKQGQIKDKASAELAAIRSALVSKHRNISKVSNAILSRAKAEGWVDEEASLSVRDGRMLIPIPTAYKRKVKGFVYDESSTGKTSYIEPYEIVEANNQIRELEFAERREIIRILVNVANEIRPYIDDLSASYDFLSTIDFIRAKARFAIDIEAIRPQIIPSSHMKLRAAIHPLLLLSFRKENRFVVPLDLAITENERILLISGPNAGGKSVCLKTVGLLQYMLQCGMLIPVEKTSETGIFTRIFIDIGDEQSIENDLSTYSSHLKNMHFFCENATNRTLFLIDEFGTGTEPLLGGAIAEAVLEKLNQEKAFGVITTHYTNLKHFAETAEGVVNGAMLFDSKKMQPLYVLEIGQPGSSFAFEIAKKTGLAADILQRAMEKVGTTHIDYDKNLKKLETDRRIVLNQKRKLQQAEEKLQKTIDRYDKELEFTIRQRKNILNLSHEQANDIVSKINKRVENAIHKIKTVNAEKQKTKEERKELEKFVEQERKKWQLDADKIQAKIEQIERRKKRKKEKKAGNKELKIASEEDKTIRIGDFVKIKKQEASGEVLDKKGENVVVVFGNMQISVKEDRLEKISKNEAKKLEKQTQRTMRSIGWDVNKRKQNFVFGLDLRGKRVDEALSRVMEYIDEAILVEATEVRILHGTGTGALKQAIRDYLRTVDVVQSFRDEHVEQGGAGITVVRLEV